MRAILVATLWPQAVATVARAATVQVVVDGVRDARGHVRIGVCTKPEFLGENCRYHALVAARPGSVTATIDKIVPGTYAVAVYQDIDDLGRLKRNFFGVPREDVGFSRDPPLGLGPPGFDASDISIGDAGGRIVVRLHHFGS
ncbi:DUF2141 domain-containing protein [Lichenicoccus sp.]|uniref:DUF2141 domain-containing protein n=1 Tax=Lichenicoccus sp. TaxID=2781899 RepID=UPI003D135072